MVGLFSGYNDMDKKEDHQVGREWDEENERKILLHFDDEDGSDDDYDVGEFKPIDHPLEPPEDDQPAKCPTMPHLSFKYDDSTRMEPFPENQQLRAVSLVANEVDRRKHHKNVQDSAIPFRFRGQQYNIFEVFNQCKEFGFS